MLSDFLSPIAWQNSNPSQAPPIHRYSPLSASPRFLRNIMNCVVKTWDSSADYAGLMICQDYTSKTADECVANNLFASEKLTINVENTIGPDGKNMTDYVKESGIQNTVVYVWRDKSNPKAVHYSEMPEAYPTVKVK